MTAPRSWCGWSRRRTRSSRSRSGRNHTPRVGDSTNMTINMTHDRGLTAADKCRNASMRVVCATRRRARTGSSIGSDATMRSAGRPLSSGYPKPTGRSDCVDTPNLQVAPNPGSVPITDYVNKRDDMLGHNRFEAMITPDSESRQTSLSNTWRRFRPAPSRDQRYPVVDNVLVHVLSRLTTTENPIGRSGPTLGIKRLPVSSLTPCTSRTPYTTTLFVTVTYVRLLRCLTRVSS